MQCFMLVRTKTIGKPSVSDMKGDGIDGCVSAFVYNSITPETSEKGDIFFKIISNTIIRVA